MGITHIPIREARIGLPACNHSCYESSQESRAVKEHMKGVRDEAETVSPHAIEQLHKSKGKIQEKEEKQIPGSLL